MNETKELPSTSSASALLAGNDQPLPLPVAVDVKLDEKIKRPQFGTRCLVDQNDVFQHNAWDNVEWDDEQEQEALSKVAVNSQVAFSEEQISDYEANANCYWNEFYTQHQNRFFKDRHWLFTEFPELDTSSKFCQSKALCSYQPEPVDKTLCSGHESREDEANGDECGSTDLNTYPGHSAKRRFLEVGCGVGNTVFPVLQTNNDPTLFVYCCDFSKTAIDIVKEHADYDPSKCHAFVLDITDETAVLPFPSDSLDAIILIFVLSAVKPDKMQSVINRLARCLKPGGMILFRDYGRYDMAQLRFKKGKCLGENFYVRGDGTQVYFFTQDDLRRLFTQAGLEERQNLIDRRLQVNRGRQLKMYRVWIQCKYQKPFAT